MVREREEGRDETNADFSPGCAEDDFGRFRFPQQIPECCSRKEYGFIEMKKIGTLDKYVSYKTNPNPLSAFVGGSDAFSPEGTDIFD